MPVRSVQHCRAKHTNRSLRLFSHYLKCWEGALGTVTWDISLKLLTQGTELGGGGQRAGMNVGLTLPVIKKTEGHLGGSVS